MLFGGDGGIRPAPFVFGIRGDNAAEDNEELRYSILWNRCSFVLLFLTLKKSGKPWEITSFSYVARYVSDTMSTSALRRESTETERHQLIPDAKSCSTCGVKFEDLAEQRQHFKMDWHRLESNRWMSWISPSVGSVSLGLVFFSFKSCVSQLSVDQISRNLVHF